MLQRLPCLLDLHSHHMKRLDCIDFILHLNLQIAQINIILKWIHM